MVTKLFSCYVPKHHYISRQSVDIQGSSVSLVASGDECLSDSGTSGYESCSSEELSERERRLANLRRLARDLEASLHPNSQAWASICKVRIYDSLMLTNRNNI